MKTEFSYWLEEQMRSSGVNCTELANIVNISRQAVSRQLNGHTIPNRTTIGKYAGYFGEDTWYLYEMAIRCRIGRT